MIENDSPDSNNMIISIPKIISFMQTAEKGKEDDYLIGLLEENDVRARMLAELENGKVLVEVRVDIEFTPIAETRKIIGNAMQDTAINKLFFIAFGDSLLEKRVAKCMDKHIASGEKTNLVKTIPDSSVGYTALCARNLLIEETEFRIIDIIEWLEGRQKTIKQRDLKCPLSLPDKLVECYRRNESLAEYEYFQLERYVIQEFSEDVKEARETGKTKKLEAKIISLANQPPIKKGNEFYYILEFNDKKVLITKNHMEFIARNIIGCTLLRRRVPEWFK